MRKKILVLFQQLICISLYAQTDSSAFERLLTHCKQDFSVSETRYDKNYFDNLLMIGSKQLNLYNKSFSILLNDPTLPWPKKDKVSFYLAAADSIFKRIQADAFWKGAEIDRVKFLPALRIYKESFCPCITERIPVDSNAIVSVDKFSQATNDCETATLRNVLVMGKLRIELSKAGITDIARVEKMIPKFLYDECEPYHDFLRDQLLDQLKQSFYSFAFSLRYNLQEEALDLYKKQGMADLLAIYPDFAANKKALDELVHLIAGNPKNMRRRENIDKEPGTATIVTTYYTNPGKSPQLSGQAVIIIDGHDLLRPVIKSLRFIPVDQIANKPDLLKEINLEIPPPPPPRRETGVPPKKN